jgi:2-iminobutanoate/2-iminopropanoate deaminase
MNRIYAFALLALSMTASTVAQERQFLDPPGLPKPAGYTHVVVVPPGDTIYLSGQVALGKDGTLVGKDDFAAQAGQVFANIDTALKAAHSSFADVVKLTFYVTDATKVPALRVVRDRYVDKSHPPASTLVEVRRLVRPEFLLEVDAVAVRPHLETKGVAMLQRGGPATSLTRRIDQGHQREPGRNAPPTRLRLSSISKGVASHASVSSPSVSRTVEGTRWNGHSAL